MADTDKTAEGGILVDAAKAIGTVAGKVAGKLGAKGEPEAEVPNPRLYAAEYVGSGTFLISKPARTRRKARQTRLRNPQRGARK
jgi:hypothetical protein